MISNKLPDIRNADIAGKRVFLRADLDVPLKQCKVQSSEFRVGIEDDMRLVAGLPTIKYLLEHGAKVIIGGHLGRPQNKIQNSKFKIQNYRSEFSLMPIAEWMSINFQFPISNFQFKKIDGLNGWRISENLFLLENLRFYPGEEKNDPDFAKQLANLADLYVNDAFAMCHRSHASVVGIPNLLPHFAGIRLTEEVKHLSSVLDNPKRPLVVIIGGKKIETKLPLVEKMISLADKVLVGGLIVKEILKPASPASTRGVQRGEQVQDDRKEKENLVVAELNSDGTDITKESLNEFISIIKTAGTIVWNGPMGKIGAEVALAGSAARAEVGYENFFVHDAKKLKGSSRTAEPASVHTKNFVPSPREGSDSEKGTLGISKAIAEGNAYKVVGGGDTTEFLKRIGLIDKFDFVSTGGGAMLTFLNGQPLPGLEALLE